MGRNVVEDQNNPPEGDQEGPEDPENLPLPKFSDRWIKGFKKRQGLGYTAPTTYSAEARPTIHMSPLGSRRLKSSCFSFQKVVSGT